MMCFEKFVAMILLPLMIVGNLRAEASRKFHTKVSLVSERSEIAPGESFDVGLLLKMEEHWHTYWKDPGDAGLATSVTWTLPSGFTADPIRWPKPQVMKTGPLTTYGYEREVLLLVRIHAPEEGHRPGQKVKLEGGVVWQECNEICRLGSTTVSLSLPIANTSKETSADMKSLFERYRALTPPDDYHPSPERAARLKEKEIAANQATTGGAISPLQPASLTQSAVSWQSVAARFKIQTTGTGYMDQKAFLDFLKKTSNENGLEKHGVLAMLFIIFFGGMALNLTPCVLPLIPINLAIIGAGSQAQSKARGLTLGSLYGLGMAVAYGSLGIFVVLTGSKFGALNASPWFNIAIALIFVVLALAMFDVITIDFTRFQSGMNQSVSQTKGRLGVVFALGVVSALLAGACVAPVVLSVILLASKLYSNGVLAGLFLPFLLGAGMAAPWPLAGAGISCLPKPGKWMNRVKYAFGVIILALAFYYGHLAYDLSRNQVGSSSNVAGNHASKATPARQQQDLIEALAEAEQTGMPVFIDFWASWCKNCLAMDATTFTKAEVKQKLGEFVVVKFQAEHLDEPQTKEVLDYFGVIGLPTYVILQPK